MVHINSFKMCHNVLQGVALCYCVTFVLRLFVVIIIIIICLHSHRIKKSSIHMSMYSSIGLIMNRQIV